MFLDAFFYYTLAPLKNVVGTVIGSLFYFIPVISNHTSNNNGFPIFLLVISLIYITWIWLTIFSKVVDVEMSYFARNKYMTREFNNSNQTNNSHREEILYLQKNKDIRDKTKKSVSSITTKKKKKKYFSWYRFGIGIAVGLWIGLWFGIWFGFLFNLSFGIIIAIDIGFGLIVSFIIGLILGLNDFKIKKLYEIRERYKRRITVYDFLDLLLSLPTGFTYIFMLLQMIDPDQIPNWIIDRNTLNGIIIALWNGYYISILASTHGTTQFVATKFWSFFFYSLLVWASNTVWFIIISPTVVFLFIRALVTLGLKLSNSLVISNLRRDLMI
jgi:hypothetical protein